MAGMAEKPLEQGTVSISLEETKQTGGAPPDAAMLTHLKKVEKHITAVQRFSHLPWYSAVDLEFKELSYTVFEGPWWKNTGCKVLLKGLSGKFCSGELIGLMGPSGAGKSTLLNILAGYKETGMKGQIMVNGRPRDLHTFRKMSCCIMQDDMLQTHLTTWEAMVVSANCKLNEPMEVKKELVNEILTALGLQGAAHTCTHALSGGQRKRLAIALQLVNSPSVMFLDDATSSTCKQVVSLMRSLAQGGRTIICTLNQPSVELLGMFDKLYILSQGQCIYKGTVPYLIPYLKNLGLHCPAYHNPADFIIEVASGQYGDLNPMLFEAVQGGMCSDGGERNSSDQSDPTSSCPSLCHNDSGHIEKRTFATSMLTQIWTLFKRNCSTTCRDMVLPNLRVMLHLGFGVLIGLLFLNVGDDASEICRNAQFFFSSMLFLMFAALMPSLLTFPLEMSVLISEHPNNWYSLKAYNLAKIVVEIKSQVTCSIIYCSIVYWMTGQPPEADSYLLFTALYTSIALVAQSLGLFIGAACLSLCEHFTDTRTKLLVATVIGMVTAVSLTLLSGFSKTLTYLQWISYFPYVRYGSEGVVLSAYGMNQTGLECLDIVFKFQTPEEVLQPMEVEDGKCYVDFIVFGIFFLILHLAIYLVPRYKVKSER